MVIETHITLLVHVSESCTFQTVNYGRVIRCGGLCVVIVVVFLFLFYFFSDAIDEHLIMYRAEPPIVNLKSKI